MINIGVICDVQWNNFILINNKLKKMNSEHHRIHSIYCNSLEIINNCCSANMLTLIRHYSVNLSKTIYNMLKICDLWIIFTNYTEFNNSVNLVIEKCEEYNIKYIVVSEHSRENDYYSFPVDLNMSFKKKLNSIIKEERPYINEFNYQIYNDSFITKNNTIKLDFIYKIKQCYSEIDKYKNDRSIKLLYDKDEIKREKQTKKTIKDIKLIDFSNNKINYYKKN